MSTRKRIFDMDGTLYPYTASVIGDIQLSIGLAAIELGAPLEISEAAELSKKSYEENGHSAYVFEKLFNLDHTDLMITSYKLTDEKIIVPDRRLINDFRTAALPHKESQIILTSSIEHWASRMVPHLSMSDCFKAVVCLNHCDHKYKHNSDVPYDRAFELFSAEPKDFDLIEDSKSNLEFAKTKGLRTIYVHHGNPLDKLPSYIDYQVAQPDQVYAIG